LISTGNIQNDFVHDEFWQYSIVKTGYVSRAQHYLFLDRIERSLNLRSTMKLAKDRDVSIFLFNEFLPERGVIKIDVRADNGQISAYITDQLAGVVADKEIANRIKNKLLSYGVVITGYTSAKQHENFLDRIEKKSDLQHTLVALKRAGIHIYLSQFFRPNRYGLDVVFINVNVSDERIIRFITENV